VYESLYQTFKHYAQDPTAYKDLPPLMKNSIRDQIGEAYDMIAQRKEIYEERTSAREYAYALQSARVVVQAEDVYAQRTPGYIVRDTYMAENVEWILEQEGPEAKIVLWAHNYHVSVDPVNEWTMGSHLRNRFGDDMIVLGFNFFKGSFNAVEFDQWEGYKGLKKHTVGAPPQDAYSYRFRGADIPRFFLDLRTIDFDSTATDWIPGPRPFRSIGAVYDPDRPELYFDKPELPKEYDVIIYFENTAESILLPFPDWTDGLTGTSPNERFERQKPALYRRQ
jgi:erythromycin esterase